MRSRRVKKLLLCYDAALQLFQHGIDGRLYGRTEEIPEDARVLSIDPDPCRHAWGLIIESEEFDEVEECGVLPEFEATYRYDTDTREPEEFKDWSERQVEEAQDSINKHIRAHRLAIEAESVPDGLEEFDVWGHKCKPMRPKGSNIDPSTWGELPMVVNCCCGGDATGTTHSPWCPKSHHG